MKKLGFYILLFFISNSILAQDFCNDRFLCQCTDIKSSKDVDYREAVNFSGVSQKLKLDIYTSDDAFTPKKRPLIVFIHGGAFVAGNKTDFATGCETFAKLGYTAATVQYRLGYNGSSNGCNSANWPEMKKAFYRAVQDAGSAINYLVDNADKYNIDTNNIILFGYSAGAVTVLHTAYCNQQEMNNYDSTLVKTLGPLPTLKGKLKGVVSLAGFLGSTDFLSGADKNIPLLMYHGTCDFIVGYDAANCLPLCATAFPVVYGSLPLSNKAKEIGMPYQFITYCGQGHDLLPTLALPVTCSGIDFIQKNILCGQPITNSLLSYIPTGMDASCTTCVKPPVASVPIGQSICGLPCTAASNYCKVQNGINDIENNLVEVYPNPVDNTLNLKYANDLVIKNAYLVNTLGQLNIVTINQNTINTNSLNKGLYWLKLETNKGEVILKFIK